MKNSLLCKNFEFLKSFRKEIMINFVSRYDFQENNFLKKFDKPETIFLKDKERQRRQN